MFALLSVLAASTASGQDFLKMEIDELPVQAAPNDAPFMLGPAVGYLGVRDADESSWYGGLMARLRVAPFLGLEASGAYTRFDFQEKAIRFTQVPVQVSALVFPLSPPENLRPYVLAGVGFYPTRIEYRGSLAALEDDRDTTFAFHVGGGAEMQAGPSLVFNADLRWIFQDEPDVDNASFDGAEFGTIQFAVGVGLQF
ncbi:MAG TPA: outer membrane beta-barrel protein [Planctomycetota bacterium]